jgi:hypothetical protein
MNGAELPSEPRITNKRVGRLPTPEQLLTEMMHDMFNDLISEQVVHRLGSPADLLDVRVFRLWADHYRVNVLVGRDVATRRVADSFFLVTDNDGKIVSSSPAIARLY